MGEGAREREVFSVAELTPIEAASEYVQRGWWPIPLHHLTPEGCSCGETEEGHAVAKHPRERSWQKGERPSAADVYTLWEKWPEANVGLATGDRSGFWVLDVDPKNGGNLALRDLMDEYGELPATYEVSTGSGGHHFYFALPDFPVGNSPGRLPKGLDVRGTGGQVVAPPSTTDLGTYRVLGDVEPAEAPAWLLDLIRPKEPEKRDPSKVVIRATDEVARYVGAAWEGEVSRVLEAEEDRNITLNRATFSLASIAAHEDSGVSLDEVREAMEAAGLATGLGALEVRKTVASAIRGGLEKPREPWPPEPPAEAFFIPFSEETGTLWPTREWDDLGNADRLVDHYGGQLLWITTDNAWSIYQGGRWLRDQDAAAQAMAQRMLARLPETEAASYPADDHDEKGVSTREKFLKFVAKQRSSAKVAAMLKAARGLPELHAQASDFDTDPWALNVRNGVVDLRSGELLEHSPERRFQLRTEAAFTRDASYARWLAFLERTQPDPLVRDFLQRLVGYTITGETGEQVMALHHGSGANGKSVFLKVLGDVLGDYSQVVPRSTLIVKSHEGIPTDVARMVGRRFLQTSETAAGRRMDEEVVKSITGGDTQVARHLYGREFEFTPQGTIHYATNHLPRLTDAESIWRRMILVGWNVVIPPEEQDHSLASRIVQEEAEGVLAWAVQGCAQWRERGLLVPESCRLALEEFREDSDLFGDFLRGQVVSAPGRWTPVADLYRVYQRWTFDTGTKPMAQNSFSVVLKERGYTKERRRVGSSRVNGFLGIAPRETVGVEFPPSLEDHHE